jgi:hypothetical protein
MGRTGVLGAVLALGACAHDEGLVPAPQARRPPGAPRIAYDEQRGVEVLADGDAWRGDPRDLEDVMTPISVTIRNHRERPIRISYQEFALQTPSGARLNPLPPFSMRAPGPARTAVVSSPLFAFDRFYVAPYYRSFYPTMQSWWRTYPYDAGFHHHAYVQWRVQLPTEDMLRAALPEGVIAPGGSVSGFLYFPDVARRAQGVFTLRAEFPEEDSTQSLASVRIPLVTK